MNRSLSISVFHQDQPMSKWFITRGWTFTFHWFSMFSCAAANLSTEVRFLNTLLFTVLSVKNPLNLMNRRITICLLCLLLAAPLTDAFSYTGHSLQFYLIIHSLSDFASTASSLYFLNIHKSALLPIIEFPRVWGQWRVQDLTMSTHFPLLQLGSQHAWLLASHWRNCQFSFPLTPFPRKSRNSLKVWFGEIQ